MVTPLCPVCRLPVATTPHGHTLLGECCGFILEFDLAGELVSQEVPF